MCSVQKEIMWHDNVWITQKYIVWICSFKSWKMTTRNNFGTPNFFLWIESKFRANSETTLICKITKLYQDSFACSHCQSSCRSRVWLSVSAADWGVEWRSLYKKAPFTFQVSCELGRNHIALAPLRSLGSQGRQTHKLSSRITVR